jgi:hypothetical protein
VVAGDYSRVVIIRTSINVWMMMGEAFPSSTAYRGVLVTATGRICWLDYNDQRQQEQHRKQSHHHRCSKVVVTYRVAHCRCLSLAA